MTQEEHDPYLQVEALEAALSASHTEAAELRKMVFQQGENAATAAKEYAENMAAMRAEAAELKARVEAVASMALAALDCGQTIDPREVIQTLQATPA